MQVLGELPEKKRDHKDFFLQFAPLILSLFYLFYLFNQNLWENEGEHNPKNSGVFLS